MVVTEPVEDAVPELGVGKDGGGGGRIDGLGVGFDDDDHKGGWVIEFRSFEQRVDLMSGNVEKRKIGEGGRWASMNDESFYLTRR